MWEWPWNFLYSYLKKTTSLIIEINVAEMVSIGAYFGRVRWVRARIWQWSESVEVLVTLTMWMRFSCCVGFIHCKNSLSFKLWWSMKSSNCWNHSTLRIMEILDISWVWTLWIFSYSWRLRSDQHSIGFRFCASCRIAIPWLLQITVFSKLK